MYARPLTRTLASLASTLSRKGRGDGARGSRGGEPQIMYFAP